jgi:hypothetical protein
MYKFIFAVIMSIFMGLFMSFFMTMVNIGFPDHFLMSWMRAFAIGIVVALPTALLIAPLAHKIASFLVKKGGG